MPGKGADDDHEHHTDKGGNRDLFDQLRCEQNEGEKKQRRGNAGKTGAST